MTPDQNKSQPQKKEDLQETRHPSDVDMHPIWEKDPDDVEEEEENRESGPNPPQH